MEEYILHYEDEDKSTSTIILSSFDPPAILKIRDKHDRVLYLFQHVGGKDYLQIPLEDENESFSIGERWEKYQAR